MTRKSLSSLLSAFVIIVIGNYVIVAQTLSGTWTASPVENKETARSLHLMFDQGTKEARHRTGMNFDPNELQGLSVPIRDGNASFRLTRPAGVIEMNGAFSGGKGSGTFVFNADQGFIDAMRTRGFDFLAPASGRGTSPEQRLFTAATLNVTVALADDLRTANFPDLDADDLFKAAIFKIDGKFLAEMAAAGYPNLTMDDVVKARIFKIDADYIRSLVAAGMAADGFDKLVKYKIFKVTPEFLNELRANGLTDINPEEVVKLRIFKIDANTVREARAADPNVTVQKIISRKIGVRVD